jgi:hypothetical protein
LTSAAILFRELEARGAKLRAIGGRLRCEAPKGTLTPEDARRLRESKADLLHLLAICPDERLKNERREAMTRARAEFARHGHKLSPETLERAVVDHPRPHLVLFGEDVALLAEKSERAIRAVLEVCRVFPGARIVL